MTGRTSPKARWCGQRTRSNTPKNCASIAASSTRRLMASTPDALALTAPEVEIFTDGACSGNPGPGGWGTILRFGQVEKELSGGAAATTNNRMELTAAIEGLTALKRPCRVRLYTDSQYLRDGIM